MSNGSEFETERTFLCAYFFFIQTLNLFPKQPINRIFWILCTVLTVLSGLNVLFENTCPRCIETTYSLISLAGDAERDLMGFQHHVFCWQLLSLRKFLVTTVAFLLLFPVRCQGTGTTDSRMRTTAGLSGGSCQCRSAFSQILTKDAP